MQPQQNEYSYQQLPIQMKVAKILGIDDFLLRNIVFKRQKSKYSICKFDKKNIIVIGQQLYQPPINYTYQVIILEQNGLSVPIFHLIPRRNHQKIQKGWKSIKKNIYIIYSHGNSSDMSDSIKFIQKISYQFSKLTRDQNQFWQNFSINFIVYDYTGFGESRNPSFKISEESLCNDLQIVLSWLVQTKKVCFDQIILWGFSLGTFPVAHCSHIYPIKACILQSPFASVAQFFRNTDCISDPFDGQNMKQYTYDIAEDRLSNLKYIDKINCEILILHSLEDQLIPYRHSRLLLKRYQQKNKRGKLEYLQITKLYHNQMHRYLCSMIENPLKKKYFQFFTRILSMQISTKKQKSEVQYKQFHTLKPNLGLSKKKSKIFSEIYNKQTDKQIHCQDKLRGLYQDLQQAQLQQQSDLQIQCKYENGMRKHKIKNYRAKKRLDCYCIQRC